MFASAIVLAESEASSKVVTGLAPLDKQGTGSVA